MTANEPAAREDTRVAWSCTYTPLELITSVGLLPSRLTGEGYAWQGDSFLHATLCSYARNCLVEFCSESFCRAAVLVNSCHAMEHLFYALEKRGGFSFLHLLDLPRQNSDRAQKYWSDRLRELHCQLKWHCGVQSSEEDIWQQVKIYENTRRRVLKLYDERKDKVFLRGEQLLNLVDAFSCCSPGELEKKISSIGEGKSSPLEGPRILLSGSMLPKELPGLIEKQGGILVLDDLCRGRRAVHFPYDELREKENKTGDPYEYLAALYLGKNPCARMVGAAQKLQKLKKDLIDYRIDGVVFFNLKFCDPWLYYGQLLKEKLTEVPVLFLEGEYSPGVPSQLKTRIDAFLEMLY